MSTLQRPKLAIRLPKIPHFEVSIVLLVFAGKLKAVAPFSLLPFDFTGAALVLCTATAIGRISIKKKLPKQIIIALAFFAPIPILVATSVAWSPQGIYSLSKAINFCLITTPILVLPLIVRNIKLSAIIHTTFALALLYAILYFYKQSTNPEETIEINYLSSSRFIATGACIGICLSTVALATGKIGAFTILIAATIGLTTSTFITGGRMPLIALLTTTAANIIYYLSSLSHGKQKLEQIGFGCLFGVALIVAIGSLKSQTTFDFHTLNRITVLFNETGMGDSATARISLINASLEAINTNPLTGTGAGGLGDGTDRVYSHNLFLEVITEYGIVPFIALCLLIAHSFGSLIAAHTKGCPNSIVLTILSIHLFNLTNAMVSGDLNDNRALFFTTSLSILTATIREQKPTIRSHFRGTI
ncbi:O-antigen ligase family protein [Pelagicoccus sp. SDUM812005]|uniref:O-antigen ligase family protein n=1 Tax=Pelagicoccus sp. SDUM812005 TaxID=3041257 RepID=UPI00280F32BE|nr:O-antigen ligase family protein [Pelagicoccus sp. SDUM812005]MDQ8180807.1 O-antigen ligase family protein [Pelagicoccus sp. SDUM812005]